MCIPLKGSNDVVGLLTTWVASPDDDDPMWHAYLLRIAAIAEVMAVGLANLGLRESLRSQSIRDPLTTLFNRRYLEETSSASTINSATVLATPLSSKWALC
jgi:GAF domain-containing protein